MGGSLEAMKKRPKYGSQINLMATPLGTDPTNG
jgi:hypothetical protein